MVRTVLQLHNDGLQKQPAQERSVYALGSTSTVLVAPISGNKRYEEQNTTRVNGIDQRGGKTENALPSKETTVVEGKEKQQ